MGLYKDSISSAQLVDLDQVAKTPEHRDRRHCAAQMMVLTGPELTDAMDRAIQLSIERLPHQLDIGVCEISGIPDLFIEQLLGGVIMCEGRLQAVGQQWDAVTAFTHQRQ